MRLGLIGAGRWGKRYMATIDSMPDIELAWLASRNPASNALVPAGCRLTPDWQDLIAAGPDGIIVATPPQTHAAIAVASIEAGIPVLIEKPLALTPAEADMINDAAVRHGVLAVVDHTHLYSPAYRELKRRGAALGPLKSLSSCGANRGPIRPDTPMLWDYAPHDIAMCIDLAGSMPASCHPELENEETTAEGTGSAVRLELDFPGAVTAHIRVSNIDRGKCRWLEAEYRDGTLRYDDLGEPRLSLRSMIDAAAEGIAVPATPPLTVAVREFCNNIAAGKRTDSSLDLGARIVGILADCDRQLRLAPSSARA